MALNVLQWGETDIAGTNFGSYSNWTYSMWLVTPYGTWYTPAETFTGSTSLLGTTGNSSDTFWSSGCLWNGNADPPACSDSGYNIEFTPASDLGQVTKAIQGALEAFNINTTNSTHGCSDFPSTNVQFNIANALDTNGNEIYPTWSTCVQSACSAAAYAGTSCSFDPYEDTGDGTFFLIVN
jgi:hypothetical protein